jgi:hypothetical protein
MNVSTTKQHLPPTLKAGHGSRSSQALRFVLVMGSHRNAGLFRSRSRHSNGLHLVASHCKSFRPRVAFAATFDLKLPPPSPLGHPPARLSALSSRLLPLLPATTGHPLSVATSKRLQTIRAIHPHKRCHPLKPFSAPTLEGFRVERPSTASPRRFPAGTEHDNADATAFSQARSKELDHGHHIGRRRCQHEGEHGQLQVRPHALQTLVPE